MSENNDKELYLNFDEYIRQGDPQKKEMAEAWRSHRFASCGRTEGIRLLAGTCTKKYRG